MGYDGLLTLASAIFPQLRNRFLNIGHFIYLRSFHNVMTNIEQTLTINEKSVDVSNPGPLDCRGRRIH